MTELLAIVPARGGSKRLPGKNLRPLAGRSLLAWTDAALRESGLKAPCLLTTDDIQIAEAGRALGWLVPFLRPAELATDDATTASAVLHALDWHKTTHGHDPELLLLLQLTSPFRQGRRLHDAVLLLREHREFDAVISVSRLHARPSSIYRLDGEGRLHLAALAGPADSLYAPNGALYAIRTQAFRTHQAFVTARTASIVLEGAESLDIDTPFDWQIAESLAGTETERGRP